MVIPQDFNPFANQAIHVPNAYHQDLRNYSSTFSAEEDRSASHEEIPFDRYIDFWLLAAALGASENHYMPIEPRDKKRFIDGSVLQRDLPAIEFLLLLAISHEKDPFVVDEPRKVLNIAEGYAATGIPLIIDMMATGHLTPQQNLTRCLIKRLSPAPMSVNS